jgi:hypothetical protein
VSYSLLCLQKTSLEGEHKYFMSADSAQKTDIYSKFMGTAHLKAFRITKIAFTGLATSIIQMTPETIGKQMLSLISSKATASRILNAETSGM